MRIDKRLHLVVPIYAEEEGGDVVAYVHSTPLSEALVDDYHMVLGQTYATIFSQGLGLAAGPPHAMRVLRSVATENGVWFDDPKTGKIGVQRGLVEEIRRLTMVDALDKEGKWEPIPLQVAVDRGVLSSSDKTEVENSIAFFIAASATLPRAQLPAMMRAAAGLWGAQVSYSNFMEWTSSLKTSTATASSGEKSPVAANDAPAHASATGDGRRLSVPH